MNKVLRFSLMLTALVVFAVGSAHAQGITKQQRFVVPFEFKIGKKVFPAGEYTFIGQNQVVSVRSRDSKHAALVLPLRTVWYSKESSGSKLTFEQSSNQYFLTQIWWPDGYGRQLRRPKSDNRLAQNRIVEIPGSDQ